MNSTLLHLFVREFKKRRKKTALITFALFWGTLSILLLLAFGRGLSTQARISLQGLGEEVIMISGGQTSVICEGLPKGRQILMYMPDILLLKQRIPEIKWIAPESFNEMAVSANGKEINRIIHGTTPLFAAMRTQIPQAGGRFLNDTDLRVGRKVAFIGWSVAEDLFTGENPVGKSIIINRVPFRVIGVLQKKIQSSMYNGPDADQVYLPLTAFNQIDSQLHIDRIHIHPWSAKHSLLIEERVRALLGKKYRFDPSDRYAVNFWNTIENAKENGIIFRGIEIFLGIIGTFTLLIGAVGVTNLMYAIVKERTQEIGIKMAIGARRRAIIQQFLLETLLIFSKGTFWGFVTAFNLIHLIRMIPLNYEEFGIQAYLLRPVFSLQVFFIYLISVGTLVFLSGIFPALRASRANPIESLRYE